MGGVEALAGLGEGRGKVTSGGHGPLSREGLLPVLALWFKMLCWARLGQVGQPPSPLCPLAVLSKGSPVLFWKLLWPQWVKSKWGRTGSRRARAWGGGVGRGAWPPPVFSPGEVTEVLWQPSSPPPPPILLPRTEGGLVTAARKPLHSGPDLFTRALGECKQFNLSDFISLKGLSVNTNGY